MGVDAPYCVLEPANHLTPIEGVGRVPKLSGRACRRESPRAAEDGISALRLLEQEDIALIVLDLNLPRVDGWSVHLELQQNDRTRNIPVIVVTGEDGILRGFGRSALLTQTVIAGTAVEHTAPYLSTIADAILTLDYIEPIDDVTLLRNVVSLIESAT